MKKLKEKEPLIEPLLDETMTIEELSKIINAHGQSHIYGQPKVIEEVKGLQKKLEDVRKQQIINMKSSIKKHDPYLNDNPFKGLEDEIQKSNKRTRRS